MSILDDLYAAIDKIDAARPIQYYATSDAVTQGKALMFKETELAPSYILLHPSDFEAKQAELSRYCRLVHLREWKPTPEQIDEAFKKVLDELPPIFSRRGWRDPEV